MEEAVRSKPVRAYNSRVVQSLTRKDVVQCLLAISVVAGFAPWFMTEYSSKDLTYTMFGALLGPEYPGYSLSIGALIYCTGLAILIFGKGNVRSTGWLISLIGIMAFWFLGNIGIIMQIGLGQIVGVLCIILLLPEAIRSRKMSGKEFSG